MVILFDAAESTGTIDWVARGLAALALVCQHWRGVALGSALAPLWRALHWEHCRHTAPPVPDLVEGLAGRCDSGGAVMTYRRRAVCSQARRTAHQAPVFFQARGRTDQGVMIPVDTLQCVDRLRSSLAFRYVVLRFERSMPQTPEETELLSREGAYDEAMLRSYTAEGEYDSFPTVEFDRLVVEHAEPRAEARTVVGWPEVQAKQHEDWVSLFGEMPLSEGSSSVKGEGNGFRLTTEEYRYVLFDWTLYPSATKIVAEPQPEPENEPAPVRAGNRDGKDERLIRPSELWSNRQAAVPPALTLSEAALRSPVEEIGVGLLFVQWKPGRLGQRRNYCYDNSSTGVRTALGIARPLDHRFVIHQSPTLPPSQGYNRSGVYGYSSGCSPMATVDEVDAHVRHAWTMEVDTRSFFAAAAKAGGRGESAGEAGSSVEDHTELHAAFVRHGVARPRPVVRAHQKQSSQPQAQRQQQESSTQDQQCWLQAPLATPAGGTVSHQPETQLRRTDHVAELARRKAALEAEIAEIRARGSGHGN